VFSLKVFRIKQQNKMKVINTWAILLIILFMSCNMDLDAKLAHIKSKIIMESNSINQSVDNDSVNYIRSILFTNIKDSAESMLTKIMEQEFIYVKLKKSMKDSIYVPTYCENKPISFYFCFKKQKLCIKFFDGSKHHSFNIDDIRVETLLNDKQSIYFSFGQKIRDVKNVLYIDYVFTISRYYNNKDVLYTCGTPADEYKLYIFSTSKYKKFFNSIEIGCDTTLLPYNK
jgi:hypothetical protein